MTASTNETVQQTAVRDLRIGVMRLARRLRNERQDDLLTPSQLAVVGTLTREGPQTPATLAAAEHVQPPSMTRIVCALEDRGWVVKTPHPTDGRQLLVELTPQAREWVRAERERRDTWLTDRLGQLTPDEIDTLLAAVPLLSRLSKMP